ncbi:hypothetical protein FSHL1_005829 [Fusarium sambucinum]
MPPEDPVKKLRDWYEGQSPLTVDIVGDFAGRELFAIHGESLIRYCLAEAKVDLDKGFQLLHAVHAVEKLLSELKRRDCNFDVLFFRDHENLCVPQQAVSSTKGAKHRLTRRILIQHFIKSNLDFRIIEFDSLESNECQNYLSAHGVHFILCDDGRASTTDQATHLQYLIWKVMASGRHVAIINSITWKSSKVFMSLLSGKKDMRGSSLKLPMLEAKEPLSLSEAVLQQITQHPFGDVYYPAREKHAMAFCRAYIEHYASANETTEADLNRVGAFLLQVATLKYCSLQERSCVEFCNEDEMIESQDHEFLHMFCTATQGLIEMPSELNEQEGWELFDIVDGRVFFYLLRAIRSEGDIPSRILEHARVLYNETFRGWDREVKQPFATLKSSKGSRPPPKAERNLTALPFNHLALESFLRDVEIGESEEIQDSNAELVFEDLRYWHAYKLVTQLKGSETLPVWFEKARQKKMQRRMAEVISYAASLTSSTGKTFNRETIVVGPQPRKSIVTGSKVAKPKHHKQKPGKGGKQNALLEAQKRNDEKAKAKLMDTLNHWRDKYKEFEKVNSPIDRYLRALDFQSIGSSGSHDAVKPEVQLYLCHILMEIWIQVRKKTREDSREGKAVSSFDDLELAWENIQVGSLYTRHRQRCSRGSQGTNGDSLAYRHSRDFSNTPVLYHINSFKEGSQDFAFEGLLNLSQLPVPGLDKGNSICHNFRFVHPVAALKDRSVLDDVNLEARDCLTLWKHMRKTIPETLLPETAKLDPVNVLPEWIEKQHVIGWEKDLKVVLRRVMKMENSPFPDLQESLANLESLNQPVVPLKRHFQKLFPLVCDLHRLDSLPALVFNYDRSECEQCVQHILIELQTAESKFREIDQAWRQKVQKFEQWKKQKDSDRDIDRSNTIERFFPNRSKDADDSISKLDLVREETSEDISRWESFDPEAPLDQFSFADMTKMQQHDFDDSVYSLGRDKVESWLIDALRRGLGVYHAGMNRRYRQIVEMLFRRGYLRVVIATGTLALGINMPCKTVIFSGDSVFLSPQNYRQASSYASRRGFDLLGNIVFNSIS